MLVFAFHVYHLESHACAATRDIFEVGIGWLETYTGRVSAITLVSVHAFADDFAVDVLGGVRADISLAWIWDEVIICIGV